MKFKLLAGDNFINIRLLIDFAMQLNNYSYNKTTNLDEFFNYLN